MTARKPGAKRGRPPLGRVKPIVSLDPEHLAALDEAAEAMNVDRSAILRALVDLWRSDRMVRRSVTEALREQP